MSQFDNMAATFSLAIFTFATLLCSGEALDNLIGGDFTDFVINGNSADISSYPFTAGLLYNGMFTCGGSIINENWILTAAHCLFESSGDNRVATDFTVVAGSSLIDGATALPVSEAVIHGNFRYVPSFTDDIALLKMSSPLTFTNEIQPALLPAAMKETTVDTPVTLLGWGFTSNGGTASNRLQQAELEVYNQDDCSALYLPLGKTIRSSELCAMAPGGGTGQCSGDSGGPLVTSTPRGYELVGVTSFSMKPCANPNYPGVYTKVSQYIDFITTTSQSG